MAKHPISSSQPKIILPPYDPPEKDDPLDVIAERLRQILWVLSLLYFVVIFHTCVG